MKSERLCTTIWDLINRYFNLSFEFLVKYLQENTKAHFIALKIRVKNALVKYNFCTCALQREWEYFSGVTGRRRIWLHVLARAQIHGTDIAGPLLRKVNINSAHGWSWTSTQLTPRNEEADEFMHIYRVEHTYVKKWEYVRTRLDCCVNK